MQFTRNILKVYRSATPEQLDSGINWYPNAHNLAFVIGRGDIWKGAGLLAAYSPLTPWWRNIILAVESANSGIARTDTLPNNHKAAARILSGEAPLEVLGMKTRNFATNIANAGKGNEVTVDVHAFSIAHGYPISSSQLKMGKGLYDDIAEAYRRAAKREGLSCTEMQAVTWTVWRDRYPKKAARKGEVLTS